MIAEKHKQRQTKAIVAAICTHYKLTTEEFYQGRAYKCADARKIALRLLLDLGVAHTITEAAALLT